MNTPTLAYGMDGYKIVVVVVVVNTNGILISLRSLNFILISFCISLCICRGGLKRPTIRTHEEIEVFVGTWNMGNSN